MTREEAIDILNDERIVIWTEPHEEEIARKQNEAIDMAIESLKRDRLIEAIANEMSYEEITDAEQYAKGYADGFKEALSAEQKEEELAKDIARRMATIIENEQDMRVILKNASAEPTDLISRADAMMGARPEYLNPNDDYARGWNKAIEEYWETIKALPSAEQVTGKLNNPCDSLLKADSESCKEQKSKLDLISRADALEQMAQAECGLHYEDCEADNCACDYIWRILNIPSADRPSGEWKQITPARIYDCSNCGHYVLTDDIEEYNYCPNCGAKMGSDTR